MARPGRNFPSERTRTRGRGGGARTLYRNVAMPARWRATGTAARPRRRCFIVTPPRSGRGVNWDCCGDVLNSESVQARLKIAPVVARVMSRPSRRGARGGPQKIPAKSERVALPACHADKSRDLANDSDDLLRCYAPRS
jgi:hypothetical protein